MVKKIKDIKSLQNKGKQYNFLMKKGFTNADIADVLKIPKSKVSYYPKRLKKLDKKVVSKLPKKYIDKIYILGANRTKREMPGALIVIKINYSLKRNKISKKEGEILSISTSQLNRILKKWDFFI